MADPLRTLVEISHLLARITRPIQEAGGIDRYRMELRRPVRGYWAGEADFVTFYDMMETAIRQGLTGAWREGAKDMGIDPDELTDAEQAALEEMIRTEQSHIGDLAERVEAGSKANGGKLQPLFDRVESMWVLRYQDARNKARAMAGADKKLMWELGRTEKHCSSCLKLAGRIKRASQWLAAGILPQNPPNSKLECGGWQCDCRLVPTDEPSSRGPFPKLP